MPPTSPNDIPFRPQRHLMDELLIQYAVSVERPTGNIFGGLELRQHICFPVGILDNLNCLDHVLIFERLDCAIHGSHMKVGLATEEFAPYSFAGRTLDVGVHKGFFLRERTISRECSCALIVMLKKGLIKYLT